MESSLLNALKLSALFKYLPDQNSMAICIPYDKRFAAKIIFGHHMHKLSGYNSIR